MHDVILAFSVTYNIREWHVVSLMEESNNIQEFVDAIKRHGAEPKLADCKRVWEVYWGEYSKS